MYPTFGPTTVGIGSSSPTTLNWISGRIHGWIHIILILIGEFKSYFCIILQIMWCCSLIFTYLHFYYLKWGKKWVWRKASFTFPSKPGRWLPHCMHGACMLEFYSWVIQRNILMEQLISQSEEVNQWSHTKWVVSKHQAEIILSNVFLSLILDQSSYYIYLWLIKPADHCLGTRFPLNLKFHQQREKLQTWTLQEWRPFGIRLVSRNGLQPYNLCQWDSSYTNKPSNQTGFPRGLRWDLSRHRICRRDETFIFSFFHPTFLLPAFFCLTYLSFFLCMSLSLFSFPSDFLS